MTKIDPKRIQGPRGTRDFYPEEQALRQYVRDVWRKVSERHGFDQVDGPLYESLDLYKVKSGDGIVSELFHFQDRGEREFAIRPEFTPTLARMVSERANALPLPIKWYCMPTLCRAERPQRGRLREFDQWNVDFIGSGSAYSDAEVMGVAIDVLLELGLKPEQVQIRLSHREAVKHILLTLGVAEQDLLKAYQLLDARAKMSDDVFAQQALALGLSLASVERLNDLCATSFKVGEVDKLREMAGVEVPLPDLQDVDKALQEWGLADWCVYDLSIVRGLAYYTGTVFELHVTGAQERALAGGGRYDQLVEMFGGPSMPAVGFGMGDVVLCNLLSDMDLIPKELGASADCYVVALSDEGQANLGKWVGQWRRQGLHVRQSYKTTRKLGKLIKDVEKSGAKYLLILDDLVAEGKCLVRTLKDDISQQEVLLENVYSILKDQQ